MNLSSIRSILLLLPLPLVLATAPPAHAQTSAPGSSDVWSADTAYVLPRGRCEMGVFATLRCGVHERLEIGTQPLIDPLMPNLSVKWAWVESPVWTVSTFHELTYPTPLLRYFSHRGAYGLIPPDEEIPPILALTNLAMASTRAGRGRITVQAGVRLARHFGEMTMQTIDEPIVFPRTSAYHHGATFQSGLGIEAPAHGRIWVLLGADLFVMRQSDARYAFEHRGQLAWRGTRFAAQAGYKLVYGQYPYGTDRNLLPWADLQWRFGG